MMMCLKLLVFMSSILATRSLYTSSEEKTSKSWTRNGHDHNFRVRSSVPQFRRAYRNTNEFRMRQNKNFENFFTHAIEQSPMNFNGDDPLRFHVEANYDDPIWPNTLGYYLNSNRRSGQWPQQKYNFNHRFVRDVDNEEHNRNRKNNRKFPKKMIYFPEKKHFSKIGSSNLERKQTESSYESEIAESTNLAQKYGPGSEEERSEMEPNKSPPHRFVLQPFVFVKHHMEDDIEEDYPPQAMVAFLRRHKFFGMPNWGENSDPHQGLKSVKIVRPHRLDFK